MCFDIRKNRSFCIFFPGFELRIGKIFNADHEKYMDEEIEKFLSDSMPINNEYFEEEAKRTLFEDAIKKYLIRIFNKEMPFLIIDNIYKVFEEALIEKN